MKQKIDIILSLQSIGKVIGSQNKFTNLCFVFYTIRTSNLNFILIFFIFTTAFLAQDPEKQSLHYYKITQDKNLSKKGYQLVLKKVISDSRCPEGVNCIWIGEAEVIVSLYKNRKLIIEKALTLSPIPKQNQEGIAWLSKYVPQLYKNIKTVEVVPYPKEGVKIDVKKYYIIVSSQKSN